MHSIVADKHHKKNLDAAGVTKVKAADPEAKKMRFTEVSSEPIATPTKGKRKGTMYEYLLSTAESSRKEKVVMKQTPNGSVFWESQKSTGSPVLVKSSGKCKNNDKRAQKRRQSQKKIAVDMLCMGLSRKKSKPSMILQHIIQDSDVEQYACAEEQKKQGHAPAKQIQPVIAHGQQKLHAVVVHEVAVQLEAEATELKQRLAVAKAWGDQPGQGWADDLDKILGATRSRRAASEYWRIVIGELSLEHLEGIYGHAYSHGVEEI
jgi:hypothetical protein